MKKSILANLSIEQNILFSTLTIVLSVLLVSNLFYYLSFSKRTDSLVASQSREINKQVLFNYEMYINSVIETSNFVQLALFNRDLDEQADELEEIFQNNVAIKGDVVSIFLFDLEGNKIIGNSPGNFRLESVSQRDWFLNPLSNRHIFHFSFPHRESLHLNREEQLISVSKQVEYIRNKERLRGVLLIELNFSTLTDLAEKTNLGRGGHILILDDQGRLVYSSEPNQDLTSQSADKARELILGGRLIRLNSQQMYMNLNTLVHT
nr:cache domain-containing protein [Spirochaetaceae bacterium]